MTFTGKLTATQLGEVHEARDSWMRMALSTDRCDRPAAEEAVRVAYRDAGLAEPRLFVWMDSPLGGVFATVILQQAANPRQRQLRGQLRGQLWDQLRDQLRGQLRDQLGDQLRDQLRDQLWGQLGDQLGDQLRDQLWGQLRDQLWGQLRRSLSSWNDGYWTVLFQRALAVAGLPRSKRLDSLATVNWLAGWWWPMSGAVVLTERPVAIHRDNQGRPHCGDGPALAYADGYEMYAWRGVRCDKRIITGDLSGRDWLGERNAELRRCIAERIGYERLLTECDARKVATDDYGTLWLIPDPGRVANGGDDEGDHDTDEDVVLVDVLNCTPEPDGHYKRYVLRVHPQFGEPGSKPADAIGWTFGMAPGEYRPLVMT